MDADVYVHHGVRIRRIALIEGGSSYEIYIKGAKQTLTHAEFRKMVLYLVRHLMEVGT